MFVQISNENPDLRLYVPPHCVGLSISAADVFAQVWLTLADQYLHSISIDWEKTLRFAFNERSNPDDDSLGIQIVKVTRLCFCVGGLGDETNVCSDECLSRFVCADSVAVGLSLVQNVDENQQKQIKPNQK